MVAKEMVVASKANESWNHYSTSRDEVPIIYFDTKQHWQKNLEFSSPLEKAWLAFSFLDPSLNSENRLCW